MKVHHSGDIKHIRLNILKIELIIHQYYNNFRDDMKEMKIGTDSSCDMHSF